MTLITRSKKNNRHRGNFPPEPTTQGRASTSDAVVNQFPRQTDLRLDRVISRGNTRRGDSSVLSTAPTATDRYKYRMDISPDFWLSASPLPSLYSAIPSEATTWGQGETRGSKTREHSFKRREKKFSTF